MKKAQISLKLTYELLSYITELVLEEKNSIINTRKVEALLTLLNVSRKSYLNCEDLSLISDEAIVRKKLQHIKECNTCEDLSMIMNKPMVRYNFGEAIPENKWVLPEEEIMMWCKLSLKCVLNDAGYTRYRTLFHELFPEIDI